VTSWGSSATRHEKHDRTRAVPGAAQESAIPAAASPAVKVEGALAGPNTKLTIERRGQASYLASIVLTSRTALILRLSKNWPKPIYQYDHDASLRFYLATGRIFQEESMLKDLSRSQGRRSPGSRALGR
jgi:hypothetical protein